MFQGVWSGTEALLLDRNQLGPEELSALPRLCDLKVLDLSHNNLYQVSTTPTMLVQLAARTGQSQLGWYNHQVNNLK